MNKLEKLNAGIGSISVVGLIALINLAWENGEQIGYIRATMDQQAVEIQAIPDEIKDWTLMKLESERIRAIDGGPITTKELIRIQKAIARLPTDDPGSWTDDGYPRVIAVSRMMNNKPVSREQVRAAFLLRRLFNQIAEGER